MTQSIYSGRSSGSPKTASNFIDDAVEFYNNHPTALLLGTLALLFAACLVVYHTPSLCSLLRRAHDTARIDPRLYKQPKTQVATNVKKSLKYESKCRSVLEDLFKPHRFPCVRPAWLKNPKTNRNLEIDCYNSDLKLGLEFDGAFHREFSSFYHKDEAGFAYQKWKDNYKRQRCQERGVVLLNVPHSVPYGDLKDYIMRELLQTRFADLL